MAVSKTRLNSLLQGIQFTDFKLYELLRDIIDELDSEVLTVDTQARLDDLVATVLPDDIVTFTYSFTARNVILTWVNPDTTSVGFYELRKGTVWDTADRLLITGTTKAVFEPLAVGTTTYLIKVINTAGGESVNEKSLAVVVPPLGNLTITPQVIDNNVLLKWTVPTSTFAIDYYEVKRDSTVLGNQTGTFIAVFETAAGTFNYTITPYDIFGNAGPAIVETARVSAPIDFILEANQTDDLSGTKVDMPLEGTRLIGPVDDAETWATHFTNNSFDQISDFTGAGFTIYAQPSQTSPAGTYEQTFDFSSVLTNRIVTVDWDFEDIIASVAVSLTISVSADNITYDTPVSGISRFATSVRYAKVKFSFTASSNKELVYFSNLRCSINVKTEVDSGIVTADKDDATGTTETFNKAFKDVDSITLSTDSIEPVTAIFDFTDIPNPVSFKVLAYDSEGNRITFPVHWIVRGKV
jgi:hypothetical protein